MVTEFKKTREIKINEFIKLIDKLLGDYVEKNSIDLVLNKKDILIIIVIWIKNFFLSYLLVFFWFLCITYLKL